MTPPVKRSVAMGRRLAKRTLSSLLLYKFLHEYGYDKDGMCLGGNCIIPTNQNHANIQNDFDQLVPQLIARDADEKEMELALEMLVRSYDPCISCSTHFLDVKFVR